MDLGESFPASSDLLNLASIQPRTSLVKFARSPRTAPPGITCTRSIQMPSTGDHRSARASPHRGLLDRPLNFEQLGSSHALLILPKRCKVLYEQKYETSRIKSSSSHDFQLLSCCLHDTFDTCSSCLQIGHPLWHPSRAQKLVPIYCAYQARGRDPPRGRVADSGSTWAGGPVG